MSTIERPQYSSFGAAMTAYFSGKVGQSSHCALADPGRIRGNVDPDASNARIADIGKALAKVDEQGRVTLELETLYPDMPVRLSAVSTKRKGYKRATVGKIDVMAQHFGGSWHERKYLNVLQAARGEAQFQLARRGLIPEPSWYRDECRARGL